MAENLLDLSTTTQAARKTITVDGKAYELRNFSELTVFAQARMKTFGERMQAAFRVDSTPEERKAGEESIDGVFLEFVVDGEAIAERLTDAQKILVFQAFLKESGLLKGTESAGKSSEVSPGSKGSTAA